jgi:predicted Zn-dependent protease
MRRFASLPRDGSSAGASVALASQLAEAERLEPANPSTHELLGLLAVRGASRSREAAWRFSRSLALRPISANSWANLAEAKYQEGDTGAVFERALSMAAALGPADPQSQRMVAHYGLAVWDEVASPTREAIERMVSAGVRRNPLEMLQIAQRRDRLDVACRHLAGVPHGPHPEWSRICGSTEARQ